MSKIYLISDTHFLHDNIVKYCDRPENHEELMIRNWNEVVGEDDIVMHLGDIAASIRGRETRLIEIFKELKGHKHLIRGNHDHKTDGWYKDNLGFESVSSSLIMGDILLTHYPVRTNDYSKDNEILIVENLKRTLEKHDINHIVHGHVHQRTTDLPNHYNVSVEAINYTPVEINALIN
jgi:calcineurin-like phosphoesterase family protein